MWGYNNKLKKILGRLVSVTGWLILWQAASILTGLDFLLASPVAVFMRLISLMQTKQFYLVLGYSFAKITIGFLAAFTAGCILGAVSGRYPAVDIFLKPPIQMMKALPIASFIILLLIWFGSKNVAGFISFIVVYPIVYTAVLEGVRQTDQKLLEMAKVFRVSCLRRLRCIYMPAVVPFVSAGLKTALGMCWKAGVSAEVIGLVQYSIGEQLYFSKLYLMTADLFAWSITVVAASFLFEWLFLRLIDSVSNRLMRP